MTWANNHVAKGLNTKHLELIELMLLEPELKNSELAARIGCSEAWCSTIKHSDLFQEEYRKRLSMHRAAVSEGIIRKTEAVCDITLSRMRTILENEEEIGLGRLAQVFDLTAKRLFPGERNGGTVVNIALADPDAIRKARERADRFRTGAGQTEQQSLLNEPRTIDVSADAEPISS